MRRLLALSAVASTVTLLLAVGCSEPTVRKRTIGEPCDPEQPSECADGICLALDNASGICTKSCQADGKCPEGYRCDDGGKAGLVCLTPPACKEDLDCPSGLRCDVDSGSCFLKVERQLCSPCSHDRQCPEGGACFETFSGERYCTTACAEDDSCPHGFECVEAPIFRPGTTEPELRKQCVPANERRTCEGGRGLCAPCKGDQECGGPLDVCVRNVVSGEQFCGRDCSPDSTGECPDGFGCIDLSGAGKGPFQCVPNSNTCVGYCDATDDRGQLLQCGLGRECDLANKSCRAAVDGRQCAPCRDNDDCRKPGRESNQCIVNECTDCPARGETFCAEPCPAVGGDADCQARFGPGFVCAPVGQSHFCVPQRGTCLSGLGLLGDSCSANGSRDCVAGICLEYGSTALCSAVCEADSDCGDTGQFRCCEVTGEFYDCSPERRNAAQNGPASGSGVCAPTGGLFGDDCSPGRPPCQSGTCLDIGTTRVCTVPCGADGACPPDFVCREAFADGVASAPVQICFPDGGGAPGSECTFGPAACADRLCIKKPSGPVCTRPCTGDDDCPDDWACEEVKTVTDETVQACVPPGLH